MELPPVIPPIQSRRQGTPRPWTFARVVLVAVAILTPPALAVVVCIAVLAYAFSRPSYGPAEAAAGEFTVAPRVAIEILPAHRSLARASFQDFDINADGAIVVEKQDELSDLATGERLGPPTHGSEPIVSIAFAHAALVAVTADQRFGTCDADGLTPIEIPDLQPTAVFADQDGQRLYFTEDSQQYNQKQRYRLYSWAKGEPLVLQCASPAPIMAATGDDISPLFATGGAIFRVLSPGQPAMLLKLPGEQEIVGLASAGSTIYFATAQDTYALHGDLAAPVVLGLGGKLRLTPTGLYVLDNTRRRVFRIVLDKAINP